MTWVGVEGHRVKSRQEHLSGEPWEKVLERFHKDSLFLFLFKEFFYPRVLLRAGGHDRVVIDKIK